MSLEMVLLVIGLLLANAFFVAAEFAVISARRSSMEPLAEAGSRSAKTVLWAMENVSLMLACCQLGITACSVALGVVAEPALAYAIEPVVVAAGLPEGSAHAVAVAIALSIIVWLHVVLGEMVPKNTAISNPDRSALIFGPALVAVATVLRPLIWALNGVANGVLRLVGIEPQAEVTSAFTADEVHGIIQRSSDEGTLHDAAGLLTGALEFSDYKAADVMVSLEQVEGVSLGANVDDLERIVNQTGFSRIPVRDGDTYVGYLHIKDVLFARPGEREEPIQAWRVRDLPAVEFDADVEDVLASMRSTGAHVASVQRGGEAVGLVFLEDIIEELVGEVRDSLSGQL